MSTRKRRQPGGKGGRGNGNSRQRVADLDWEYASDDASDGDGGEAAKKAPVVSESDSRPGETNDQKRLRIAKAYLDKVQELAADEENGGELGLTDEADMRITKKLQDDVREFRGQAYKSVSRHLVGASFSASVHRGHRLAATCVAVTPDGARAFTGSKDRTVAGWDVETGKKVFTVPGHQPESRLTAVREAESADGHTLAVLGVAASSDGRLLASASADRTVRLWDARTGRAVTAFRGHQGGVSCVAFQRGTHTLFSGSHDRSVKVWDVDAAAYRESLFGHQAEVTALDAYVRERVVAVGVDCTARLFKVAEESQLVYRGKRGAIDSVALLNEEAFVSGGQDASLSLWSTARKKPVAFVEDAHGSPDHWLSAVAALRGTDVVATGSRDGAVRLWGADPARRALDPVATIDVPGFVNGMAFSDAGRVLVAAVGQEHKFGRWWHDRKARNGLAVVRVPADALAAAAAARATDGDDEEREDDSGDEADASRAAGL